VQLHRPGTAISAEHQLRLHVYPYIGHRPIAAIRPSELEAMVHHLAAKLAPSTVHMIFGRVVTVFRSAVRDRIVTASPCVGIRLPPEKPPSLLNVLTTADVLAMADAVPDRYAALIMFGAATGLRPGELFGLTKDRVRFLPRTLVVDQRLVRVTHGIGIGPLKTRSSYRTVPLPQVVADHLAAHLARWPADLNTGVVFTKRAGRPHRAVPVLRRVGEGPGRGRGGGVGDAARSAPLLRQRAHPIRGPGEGRPGPFGARVGQDDARRLRPSVPRRGGANAGRDRRRARTSSVLRAS
jgi:integrase